METMLVELIGDGMIVLFLAFLVYWIMEWIKLVLSGKLKVIWIQPIVYLVGTLVSSLVMYVYDYVPVDMGMQPRWAWFGFVFQGGIIAALAGFIYDKYLDKD